ncbi:MAG: ribonuclease HII [Candidatus Pacebacteria bacterium]|nr:ribonuclease HII [Candidatus Paceibacterota bacterium]
MHTIGIDEVGRGPIAGPVAVGAFLFLDEKAKKLFRGVKESKQLSEAKREEWFAVIQKAKKEGSVDFQVTFQSEKVIDTKGLSYAIKSALKSSLNRVVGHLKVEPSKIKVLLDGGLKAPIEYVNQKTIIKGDEKEMTIALASICAKVMRDRKMNMLAEKHSRYGFEKHKGYGTRAHYHAIKKFGLLDTHRRSFLNPKP